jgi:ABC-type Fe3+/spermidine/putrescine transport system ATPase subunit
VAEITFQNMWKRYPDGFEAVKDMSLEVGDGEFMILVGPSGSGKSTGEQRHAGRDPRAGAGHLPGQALRPEQRRLTDLSR